MTQETKLSKILQLEDFDEVQERILQGLLAGQLSIHLRAGIQSYLI